MHILVVCLGNICRSPIAEGVLRHEAALYGLDWFIDSAGTESYHIGEPPHLYSQAVCQSKGIDISGQKARKFRSDDFERFDKIYAMAVDVYDEISKVGGAGARMDKVDLFLNELEPGSNASVTDPWYGDEEGYAEVYDIIERTAGCIIRKYGKKQT